MDNIDTSSKLYAIIESSEDAIIGKDLNGNITSWNPAAEYIFGFSALKAIGKNISLIIPDDYKEEDADIIARVKSDDLEKVFTRFLGSVAWDLHSLDRA